jgi:hypothetical protein
LADKAQIGDRSVYNFFGARPEDATKGEHVSEDISFCRRWRVDCGGEIWALLDAKIGHIGDYAYGADHHISTISSPKGASPLKEYRHSAPDLPGRFSLLGELRDLANQLVTRAFQTTPPFDALNKPPRFNERADQVVIRVRGDRGAARPPTGKSGGSGSSGPPGALSHCG